MSGLQETVIPRSDFLLSRGIGKQITGQLLTGELIKRHILIKGIDHPVAVWGNVVWLVAMVADGIGVANKI